MTRFSLIRLVKIPGVRNTILSVLAVEVIAVGAVYQSERVSLRAKQNGVEWCPLSKRSDWRKMDFKGVIRPPIRDAETAGLDDREEVIGIELDGTARAYRLQSLGDPPQHIINDLIDGVPVSVTYCDISDCTRAFTGRRGDGPLDIRQAGLKGNEMVVRLGGVYFLHRTGEPLERGDGRAGFPYQTMPFTRTTWGEWKRRHPRTDVFVGSGP